MRARIIAKTTEPTEGWTQAQRDALTYAIEIEGQQVLASYPKGFVVTGADAERLVAAGKAEWIVEGIIE